MPLKSIKSAFKRFAQVEENAKPKKRKPRAKKPKLKARATKENEMALGLEYIWDEKDKRDIFRLRGIDQKYRSTHFYVIGASGTGKTRFLEYLIYQDIQDQKGFCVIDPHGDLIEDIKGWLLMFSEKSLKEDVILIDPANSDRTATFNPLEIPDNIKASERSAFAADQSAELLMAFKKIWRDSWGARMEDLLRNSLIALSEAGLTLAEIPLLLTNDDFRRKTLEKVKHPICKQYFEMRFGQLSQKTRSEWIESTLNKVNAFLSSEKARQILSANNSTFDLRKIMDEQKILLVNLDKGRLKDTSDLLGSLLMSKIQMAAFSRTDMSRSKRTPFYLYIDEFQNFASETFIDTLAEARKYGLSVIIAHQNLSQLPEDLIASILTNCGIQIYFRVSRKDADILAKEGFRTTSIEVKDLNVSDQGMSSVYFTYPEEWENYIRELQYLPPRRCSVIHKIKGGAMDLFVENVPDPWEAAEMDEKKFKEIMKKAKIGDRYLRDRKEIEKEYQERQKKLTAIEEPKSFRDSQGKNF